MANQRVDRREVLRGMLAGAALAMAPACAKPGGQATAKATPPAKKKILILGGTGFLGPKTVDVALARGHEVTIFNRGRREKLQPLEAKVEHLYGNRDPELRAEDDSTSPKGLEQLAGRKWDVVIDNSGYYPRMVAASAQLLAKQGTPHYIYISSVSVYDVNPPAGGDETTALATLKDPSVESMGDNFENYGGLKAACERAAEAAYPGVAALVRPGYIVGPGDPTDRFTYWPARVARGGEVLAPGAPTDPLQWIDVRDLAAWLVTLAEHGTAGTFNALGPSQPARWGDVLQACVKEAGAGTLTWVPATWLAQHEMGGEDAFPIWVAPTGKFEGFHRWKHDRAERAGLVYRSINDTVRGILDWLPGEMARRARVTQELAATAAAKGEPPPKMADPAVLRAGPKPEQERELLAAFHAGK